MDEIIDITNFDRDRRYQLRPSVSKIIFEKMVIERLRRLQKQYK
jgi:hypothetical protein